MRKFLLISLCMIALIGFTTVSAADSDDEGKDGKKDVKGDKKGGKKGANPKDAKMKSKGVEDGDSDDDCSSSEPIVKKSTAASSGSAGAATLGCLFVATIAAISML
ncbi:hypothetical protein NECID01_0035 [Nematocida sp. AWRm77]|nr:hypothetical protein NECID01_0035 [Nematocida sp. AWRm77]